MGSTPEETARVQLERKRGVVHAHERTTRARANKARFLKDPERARDSERKGPPEARFLKDPRASQR